MSDTIIEQLLEDQLLAAKEGVEFILPWSLHYKTAVLAVIWKFAEQKLIPITVVREESNEVPDIANIKKVISSSYAPLGIVQQLETAANPKLLVLWGNETSKEEDIYERRVVQRALDNSVEVRNLCDAITEIQSLEDNLTEEVALYNNSELSELTYDAEGNEKLQQLAIYWGATAEEVEAMEDWEQVIEFIEQAQNAAMNSGVAEATNSVEEENEDQALSNISPEVGSDMTASSEGATLTYEQLKLAFSNDPKLPTQVAKNTVALYGITEDDVKSWSGMDRPRTDKYIAYLDAVQDQLDNGGSGLDPVAAAPVGAQARQTASAQADEYVTSNSGGAYTPLDISYVAPEPPDFSGIEKAITEGFNALVLSNQEVIAALHEQVTAQRDMIAAYKEQIKPQESMISQSNPIVKAPAAKTVPPMLVARPNVPRPPMPRRPA